MLRKRDVFVIDVRIYPTISPRVERSKQSTTGLNFSVSRLLLKELYNDIWKTRMSLLIYPTRSPRTGCNTRLILSEIKLLWIQGLSSILPAKDPNLFTGGGEHIDSHLFQREV